MDMGKVVERGMVCVCAEPGGLTLIVLMMAYVYYEHKQTHRVTAALLLFPHVLKAVIVVASACTYPGKHYICIHKLCNKSARKGVVMG